MYDPAILHEYTFDPFILHIQELHDDAAGGEQVIQPDDRDKKLQSLLEDEAQELAWGLRHITIEHGPAVDSIDEELIDSLHESIHDLLQKAEWKRVSGLDHYLTVTVSGTNAEEWIHRITDLAFRRNPGHWRVLATARPADVVDS